MHYGTSSRKGISLLLTLVVHYRGFENWQNYQRMGQASCWGKAPVKRRR
jgi:hypothetical protein